MKKLLKEKFKFFYRVLMIAKTWGVLKIIMFIPYEIYYGFKFKVNTLFSVNNNELDVLPDEKENSTEYFPTPYYVAKKVFDFMKNELKDCNFIDFGCGAGRMLMFASEYSPKKVIGIEFSKKLCIQSEINLNTYFHKKKESNIDWEIVHSDALLYEIDKSANIFFFYDPFNEKIMKQMVKRINLSLERDPRKIYIVYISPVQRHLFIESNYKIQQANINKYNKGYIIFTN